ncbi:hypothetical protein ABB37_09324 [Leptomonas pyrrhocoris]|uniref:Uncharacterized protein n=1 Tax=Leptomonas pyrrhocoris TaxID=157538 RepID=A0A0M9FR31_LEPPY|nr:hypothetical protein ABB37_09324 [Leptomonas pyrrhocoris]KPA74340.1 hypothetical protein ABB37_09324 [Leptomonas pyrrhocoris]|eukprot:XP_015652779.1 hypothetical protein ABB37_09324 [Leptomonas pyrrhocoris]
MAHNMVAFLFLALCFFVLYRYIIPRLFPQVVNRVGVVRLDDNSNTVYAFESSGMPMMNTYSRSHVKANVRRRNHQYEAAMA